MSRLGLAILLLCAAVAPARAQEPDPEIAAYVNSIKAIDIGLSTRSHIGPWPPT